MSNDSLTLLDSAHIANVQRFTLVAEADQCWRWTGPHDRYGYATSAITRRGRRNRIGGHRAAYLVKFGSIPSGLVLDHVCRNRWCVNPAHLEPVTNHENTLRQRLTGICRSGQHEMSEANTYTSRSGHRRCRECIRRSKAQRQH